MAVATKSVLYPPDRLNKRHFLLSEIPSHTTNQVAIVIMEKSSERKPETDTVSPSKRDSHESLLGLVLLDTKPYM